MRKYFYHIVFPLLALLQLGCGKSSTVPSLRETYGARDTHAFGGSVAYHLLENSFPDNWINETNSPLAESLGWLNDTAALYISVSKKLYVNDKDAEKLLEYIYNGNTVFLAASEIDTVLLKKLYCKAEDFDGKVSMPDAFTNTSVRLVDGITTEKNNFTQYFYLPFDNYFSEIDATYCRKVGYNQKGQTNCIVLFWGKGKLFLHCDPRAFSNYFLLQGENYRYFEQLLQLMPPKPEHIYWNNYYVRKNYRQNDDSFSTLSAIFKYPPLRWAFWIALLLLLLYIFFNGKRRQRTVPVIKPVQNSSVAFAEAIAGLYFKEKNNKTIAEKMITYFNEHVRSRYFLNTSVINNDFLTSLSRKSGVELGKTKKLYYDMQHALDSPEVDDQMLLQLNEQIQQFYKNKN